MLTKFKILQALLISEDYPHFVDEETEKRDGTRSQILEAYPKGLEDYKNSIIVFGFTNDAFF